MTAPRLRVVIVGGGFGGLACARALDGKPVDVLLIDRDNYHLFTPLLYQVATAGLAAVDIAQPIRAILRDHLDLTVLMGEVRSIDLAGRRVAHAHGELAYDYLVIGLGGQTGSFGHPEWEPFAPGLKSLDDETVYASLQRRSRDGPLSRWFQPIRSKPALMAVPRSKVDCGLRVRRQFSRSFCSTRWRHIH